MPVPEFLHLAAQRPAGAYEAMSASELTERCGFKVRMFSQVAAIREMLAAAGLRTEPDFATADRDEVIRLIPLAHDAAVAPEPGPETADDEFTLPQVAPKVRNLVSARCELVKVLPEDTVHRAKALMHQCGHGQLPIISAPTVCHGIVSWQSIAQHEYAKNDTPVSACKVSSETVSLDEDLFAVLPRVTKAGCAVVQDEAGVHCGIITARDVMTYLGTILEPFYVIGEIERRIRLHLNEHFTDADRGQFGEPDRFMFGKYVDILCTPERFARLGWPAADREVFLHHMNHVRKIRNTVMHFNGDGPPPADIRALHNFRKWLAHLTPGH